MVQVWNGYTEFFDELVDSLECAGIKCEVDNDKYTISVDSNNYSYASAIIHEIFQLIQQDNFEE